MAIDPVCGMEVDPMTAEYVSEYQEETYYFCSAGCSMIFNDDPEKYTLIHYESSEEAD